MSRLVVHNTLKDLAAVQSSIVGPNGAYTGTVTHTEEGPFGGSSYTGNSRANRIIFNDGTVLLPDLGKYTLEYQQRTDYPCTNGAGTTVVPIWGLTPNGVNTTEWDSVTLYSGSYWYTRTGGVNTSTPNLPSVTGNTMTWLADEWNHIAWVVDKDGIEDTEDTMRVYLNGELVLAYTGQRPYTKNNPIKSLVIGSYDEGTGGGGAYTYYENVKLYDFAKTDYSQLAYQYYAPSGFGQQFLHKNRSVGISKGTTYLDGSAVEVDIPQPDHYWKLNETSGDVVIDYGKKPINGVNYGASLTGDGYRFDGAEYCKVLPDAEDALALVSKEHTITLWFKNDNGTGEESFVAYGDTNWGTIGEWQLAKMSDATWDNRIAFIHHTSGLDLIAYEEDWDSSGWNFIAFTTRFGSTPSGAAFTTNDPAGYLDGNLLEAEPNRAYRAKLNDSLYIGSRSATSNFVNGTIKNVRIYETQRLTPQQVAAIYEEELAEIPRDEIPQPTHEYALDSLTITDQGKGSLVLPVLDYTLQETEQTSKVIDSGTNPYPLTNGGLSYGTGRNGKRCLVGNGTNSASTTGVPSSLQGSNGKTICAWVYITSFAAQQLFFAFGTVTDSQQFSIGILSAGGLNSFNCWGPNSGDFSDGVARNLNQWYHVAFRWDGTTASFVVDGVQSSSGAESYNHGSGGIAVGSAANGTSVPASSGTKIQECKAYDKYLSESELTDIMNDTDPLRTANGTLSTTAPTVVNDPEMGDVLSFNGSNNYITTDITNPRNTLSLSFWMNVAVDQIGFVCSSNPTLAFEVQTRGDNVAQQLRILYGGAAPWLDIPNFYTVGEWVHCAIDIDLDGYIIVYRNGEKVHSEKMTSIPTFTNMEIGRRWNGSGGYYFEGKLKDFKMWKDQ